MVVITHITKAVSYFFVAFERVLNFIKTSFATFSRQDRSCIQTLSSCYLATGKFKVLMKFMNLRTLGVL